LRFADDEDMGARELYRKGTKSLLRLQAIQFKPQSFRKGHHLIEFRVAVLVSTWRIPRLEEPSLHIQSARLSFFPG